MNSRVLELLKSPQNIQSEDLGLLKEEIHAFPYVQNIRALHLFGVHLYDKENYQKELSTTAAYTTDKKLLYQLINGKIHQPKPEITENKQASKEPEKPAKYSYKDKGFPIKREESPEKKQAKYEEAACMIQPAQEIKHIYVKGERNRILFEGEENFLDEANSEVIDLESTLESGVIVTQKTAPVIISPNEEIVQDSGTNESEAGTEFTPELIVEENKIDSPETEQKINQENEVSFHEVETLSPEPETVEKIEENEADEESEPAGTDSESEIIVKEEENIEEPHAEISFHGMDEFLPDVKIQGNSEDIAVAPEISKPNVNKHEEEMRRLIEEVEKKMKEAQSVPKVENEEPETADHEISFAETQSFHFWSTEKEEPKAEEIQPVAEVAEDIIEQPVQHEKPAENEEKEEQETAVQEVSTWKPMNLDSHLPDSMISKEPQAAATEPEAPKQEEIPAMKEKQEEISSQIAEEPQKAPETMSEEKVQADEEEIAENVEEIHEEAKKSEDVETKTPKEEAPVMNVSFFSTDISSLTVENAAKEESAHEIKAENIQETPADSNVPGFINTWQSWLKIDRPAEEAAKEEKIPVQEKVIEAFIENNPRISQLKEESTYVVKEKNDDISHLMTETLANLYFEQKLYTKAIKAFEILINKNPEKKEHFQSKIQEIKDFRSKS